MLFFKKKNKDESQVKEPKPKKGFYFSRENVYRRLAEKSQRKVDQIQEYLDAICWDDETCDFDAEKYDEYLTNKYGKVEPEVVYTEPPETDDEEETCDCGCCEHGISSDNVSGTSVTGEEEFNEADEVSDENIDKIISDDFDDVKKIDQEELDPDDVMGKLIVDERKKMETETVDGETESVDEDSGAESEEDVNAQKPDTKQQVTVVKNRNNNSKKVILSANKSRLRYIRGDEMKIAIEALNEYTSAKELIEKLNEKDLGIVRDSDGDCISRSGVIAFHVEDDKLTQFILRGKPIVKPSMSNQFYKNICTELGIKVHSPFKSLGGIPGKTFKSKLNSGEEIGMNISYTDGSIMVLCEFNVVENDINEE